MSRAAEVLKKHSNVVAPAPEANKPESGDLVTRLEKAFNFTLKAGRNTIAGYPVDIDDQDPADGGLTMTPVDKDALKELPKLLRDKGFKTTLGGGSVTVESLVRENDALYLVEPKVYDELMKSWHTFMTNVEKLKVNPALDKDQAKPYYDTMKKVDGLMADLEKHVHELGDEA